MRVDELTLEVLGQQIEVTYVEPSKCVVDDEDRLLGQIGVATTLNHAGTEMSQLVVQWETPRPGTLMLCGRDEIQMV